MTKRSKGIVLLFLGVLLLLAAGGWYVYNLVEDQNAGQQAAELLEQFDVQQKDPTKDETPTETAPTITVGGDAFCGKVSIEALGIELPVYDEWSYPRFKIAPCRYSGSVATNDMIIAAHNYKSHFGYLHKLQIGDSVRFTDAYGTVHQYQVCELILLDGTAVSDMQSGGWDFTLFTCTKGGEQRVTVRCEKVDQ